MEEHIVSMLLLTIITILYLNCDAENSAISDLQAWGNGGWRPAFFTLDTPQVCTGLKRLNPKWFQEFIKSTGQEDCPVPPGTYHLSTHNISFAEFTVPMWEYGRYKVINQVYKEGVLVGCLGMILEVTPKRRLLKRKH
ncbi:uncharacterized protein [Halyomorpha halys]|uniref:uncharacterized protein n=1 Tax=Halyomorpha halys TaxID=286706 RepID=UPI0034D17DE8